MLQRELAKVACRHDYEMEEVKEEEDWGWSQAEWDEWYRQGVKSQDDTDSADGPQTHYGVQDLSWLPRDRSSSTDESGSGGGAWTGRSWKNHGWNQHQRYPNKQWVKQEWWDKKQQQKPSWAYDRSSKPSGTYVKGGYEADGTFYPYL